MPLIHFVDQELSQELNKLPKGNENPSKLDEHRYLAQCLRLGLRIEDLKELEYKDVAKIMLCYISDNKPTERMATQKDIDRFLS